MSYDTYYFVSKLFLARMNNCKPSELGNEITNLFLNSSGATDEACQLISEFIPHNTVEVSTLHAAIKVEPC